MLEAKKKEIRLPGTLGQTHAKGGGGGGGGARDPVHDKVEEGRDLRAPTHEAISPPAAPVASGPRRLTLQLAIMGTAPAGSLWLDTVPAEQGAAPPLAGNLRV